MKVQHFFDSQTFTLTYVVYDEVTRDAVVIDPVLDYSPIGAVISYTSLTQLSTWIQDHDLRVRMILETHAHADHLSGAQILKRQYPEVVIGVGKQIVVVQQTFKDVFDLHDLATDGSQFDLLLEDDKSYQAGSLTFRVLHTPGHTPACCSFLFGKWVFVGDLIFMPDFGTGRCDFPQGSAADSYRSVTERLFALPDDTIVCVGHDYMPHGRPLAFKTSLAEQKEKNIHINLRTSEQQFVRFRTERDAELTPPRLLYESVQFNIGGGFLPPAQQNGRRYLKLPLNIEGECGVTQEQAQARRHHPTPVKEVV